MSSHTQQQQQQHRIDSPVSFISTLNDAINNVENLVEREKSSRKGLQISFSHTSRQIIQLGMSEKKRVAHELCSIRSHSITTHRCTIFPSETEVCSAITRLLFGRDQSRGSFGIAFQFSLELMVRVQMQGKSW